MNREQVLEQLLQHSISKEVKGALNNIGDRFSTFLKEETADPQDVKAAKLTTLEMIRNACQEFYADAGLYIENN